jgi:hypothetical protein
LRRPLDYGVGADGIETDDVRFIQKIIKTNKSGCPALMASMSTRQVMQVVDLTLGTHLPVYKQSESP